MAWPSVMSPATSAEETTSTANGRCTRYGPFLTYLETIVRVADWRASAGSEVAR
ncbi:MAG TPA: hypothetical protein VNO54_24770 [Streptosporangiaceae bacterium]|nr:hypothetical protein [Streptosporangiaceae bacterium]